MPDFARESEEICCGIDEVGRGPLAGPVIAACVFIPACVRTDPIWQLVTDSKKLSPAKRQILSDQLKHMTAYGIGEASVQEIDDINILQASLRAMQRAYDAMIENNALPQITLALIDGNKAPQLPVPCQTIIKGDSLSCSIAAASIIAKVHRDAQMQHLHELYPDYGWNKNAGYGTAQHMKAIQTHGITPHHRQSFAPIRRHATGEK